MIKPQRAKGWWLAGALVLIGGCGDSSQPPAVPQTAAADAQIKAIENNPNMPADVKEATLQRLRQGSSQAEAMKGMPKSGS